MIAVGLDHVGVAVHDLDTSAAEWQALGFQLTPTAPHLPGGITANRCVMLSEGYIELLAQIGGRSATLEGFLARYEGIHVLSLTTDDAAAAARRLGREVVESQRATPEGTARFARVVLPELVPRVQLIQHLTPALVRSADQTVHANGAAALTEIVITAAAPAVVAAALSRAAGVPVVPDPAGGFALRLGSGAVRVLRACAAIFPGLVAPSQPFVAGIVIRAPARAGQSARASGVAIRFTA